jgi:Protein of unknown function (DUF3309)
MSLGLILIILLVIFLLGGFSGRFGGYGYGFGHGGIGVIGIMHNEGSVKLMRTRQRSARSGLRQAAS